MAKRISLREFRKILPLICDKKTAYCAREWSKNNPLWGHCAVVALLIQEIFGGDILRASLKGTEFAKARFHFWNLLPDKQEADETRIQFRGKFPKGLKTISRKRNQLLRIEQVAQRYNLIRNRLKKELAKRKIRFE